MRNALGTGEGTTVDNEDGTYTIKYRVSDKGNYEVRQADFPVQCSSRECSAMWCGVAVSNARMQECLVIDPYPPGPVSNGVRCKVRPVHPSTWTQGGLPLCLVACACLLGATLQCGKLHGARCMLGHAVLSIVRVTWGLEVDISAFTATQASGLAYSVRYSPHPCHHHLMFPGKVLVSCVRPKV